MEQQPATPNKCRLSVSELESKILNDYLLEACNGEYIDHGFSLASDFMLAIRLSRDTVMERVAKALNQGGVSVVALEQKTLLAKDESLLAIYGFHQRNKYSTLYCRVWCDNIQNKQDYVAWVRSIFKDNLIDGDICGLRWVYKAKHGLTASYMEELMTDEVFDEAYPVIIKQYGSLVNFAKAYLDSDESILLLQGPPGTGKSRLIRYLMRKLVQLKKLDNVSDEYDYDYDSSHKSLVLYSTDTDSLKSDELFATFMTSDELLFVVEDADNMLRSRASGNDDVHRFLTVSDGIIRNVGRKIIFTTNLANMHDVDEALTRPGRCFGAISLNGLKLEEALSLADKLSNGNKQVLENVARFLDNHKLMTVAEVYKTWKMVNQSK